MAGSVQGSAIDDSFEFLPDAPDAWVFGVTAQARVVEYQYTVEPGDDRSAIDDRCPTEYGPYTAPFARPIIRPATRVSISQPSQPVQPAQPVIDHATPQPRSSRTMHTKKRPSARFVIRGKNGETRVMNNPFIQRAQSKLKKSPTQVPEPHDEGSSNKDTSATAVRPPGFKIRIKGKNGEETIREFKTPLFFPSASSRVIGELHSDDTTVVADDSISVKNQRTAPTVQTPVRATRYAAATTRLPTIEERSGKPRVNEPQLQLQSERVIEHVQHEKSVSPAPPPSIMSTSLKMSGALPPASSTATAPPCPVPATTLSDPTPTAPLCSLPTAPPSRSTAPPPRPTAPPSQPATSSRTTPVAPSPASTKLPPSKPTESLSRSSVHSGATYTSSARLSKSQRTPSKFAAALEVLNRDQTIPEHFSPVNTTSERSSLRVPSNVTWSDTTQHQKPTTSENPTKVSNFQSASTQQSVRSTNSSHKPKSSETKASSNVPSPRPVSEVDVKAGFIDAESQKGLGSQKGSVAESWKSNHSSGNGTGKVSQVSATRARSSSASVQQAETFHPARVSASMSVAAGAEQQAVAQPQSKADSISRHEAWDAGSVNIPETMPSKPVSQISDVKGSGRSRHSSQKEKSAFRSPSLIDALAVQDAEGWENISVPASRNSDRLARSPKPDERLPSQPSSISGTVNTRMSARSNQISKSGEHLSNQIPSMIDAISCQGSVAARAEKDESHPWGRQSSTSRQDSQAGVLNTTATSLKSVSQVSEARTSGKSRHSFNQGGKSQSASPFSIDSVSSPNSEQDWGSALPSDAVRLQLAKKQDDLLPIQDLSRSDAVAFQATIEDYKSVSSISRRSSYSSMKYQQPVNQSVSASDTAKVGASQSSRQSSRRSEQPTSHNQSKIDTAASQDDNQSWESASLRDHKPFCAVSERQQNVNKVWNDVETRSSRGSRTSAQVIGSGGHGAASPDSRVDASENSQDTVQKDWMNLTSRGRGQLELIVSRQSYYRWKRPSDSLFSSSDRGSKDIGKGNSRSSSRSHAAEEVAVGDPVSHTLPRSEVMPWWDELPPPAAPPPPSLLESQRSQSEQRFRHGSTQEGSSVQLESQKSRSEQRFQEGSSVQLEPQESEAEPRSQHGSTQEGSSAQGGVRLSQYGSMAESSSRICEPTTTQYERSISHQSHTTPSGSVRINASAPLLDDRASRVSRSSFAGSSRQASGRRSTAGTRPSSITSNNTVKQDEHTPEPWDEQPIYALDTIHEQREPSSRSQISTYSEQHGSTKYARLGDLTSHPLSPAASIYTTRKPPSQEPAWKIYRQPYMETVRSETQSSGSRWYDDSSSESGVKMLRGRCSGSMSNRSGGSRDSVEAVLYPRTRQIPVMDEQANEDWRSVSSKRTGSAIDAAGEESW